LNQIYSDNEEKTVREELKLAFFDVIELEKTLKKVEEKMSERPEDLELIENYTSLLEQFNNI